MYQWQTSCSRCDVQQHEDRVGFLTKLFSGFSRNTKLAKMRLCFAKLSRVSWVSQDQIFAIFAFCESYNFRETREIRLIKHYRSCQGFKKSGEIEKNQCIYNLLSPSLLYVPLTIFSTHLNLKNWKCHSYEPCTERSLMVWFGLSPFLTIRVDMRITFWNSCRSKTCL